MARQIGPPNLQCLPENAAVAEGLPKFYDKSDNLCSGCLHGKMAVAAFPKESKMRTNYPLQLVRSVVMGPMKIKTPGGTRFMLSFIDDFSTYVNVYFLMSKSEFTTKFIEYKNEMELQCGTKIKGIRTDNGKTVPYSSQQNGVAARMNRTITEMARSMMHYKCVSQTWWAEAVKNAVHLINRITICTNKTMTPFEMCFKTKPTLRYMRVFGSDHLDMHMSAKQNARNLMRRVLARTLSRSAEPSHWMNAKWTVSTKTTCSMIEPTKPTAQPHVCDTDYESRGDLHYRGNNDVDIINGSDEVDMEGQSGVDDVEMDAPMRAIESEHGFRPEEIESGGGLRTLECPAHQ
uniref:Putative polyprotein n=1 Tax=Albugo laibachii Nc14 TaxID=890382 RepID=F0W8N3_9STRA|nr:putative polyprotein [Albugo laibachii Nc14]|eukprot:CCA17490.1 putative polyprotein [Albugo laibachii Nc14]